mmetsp:Transcript_39088/g.96206  ORF Transcript_39088/g.96206 Transcript_39088/m.96206 type:complete len:437 (+) Transcript_39088:94-1404(+)
MATASWLDPSTRKERLYDKRMIERMPMDIHHLPPAEVAHIRVEMCEFIRDVGKSLNMYKPALSCACVLFSRFYARNGFNDNRPRSWSLEDWQTFLPQKGRNTSNLERRLVAVGCLFLAGKIEDNPKKVNDIVKAYHHAVRRGHTLDMDEQRFLRDTILAYERLLLQDIEFDMIVEAPVAFNQMALLLKYVTRKNYQEDEPADVIFKLKDLVWEDLTEEGAQMLSFAAQFVDASLLTTLWLQYDAPTIAIGIVWMTSKFFYYAGKKGWWERLERQFQELNTKRGAKDEILHSMNAPPQEVLEDIAEQMVEYYQLRGMDPVQAPPLPDCSTGLGHVDTGTGDAARAYTWRHPRFETGRAGEEIKSWISRENGIFRCSCDVWKAYEALDVKEEHRTCRCLLSYLGGTHERQRVGAKNADVAEDIATHIAEERSKRQRRS